MDVSPEGFGYASDVGKMSSEPLVAEPCKEFTCSNSQVSVCACTVDASRGGGRCASGGLRASHGFSDSKAYETQLPDLMVSC